ncbi:glycine cleavage system protein GcvH [Microbacterium sp. ZXX196]|uniref:glycine cleavage system protein GcvH n=1 Tax=Microbacterium sp. ZXX196 TaxID=2609291 RepID=UPI0012B9FC20|nr:glycine cleavage system protein GcvH [Microbacterium sp. ZXX196]MTE22860.1 glycine cleavage system protein GcvH [Microbacterium sp. ZXX196]
MTDLTTLSYTAEHEWVAVSGDIATIGITDHAAEQLGDVVYIDMPTVGQEIAAGDVMGEIESTKSVSELYAPVSGTVVEINEAADADTALVNADPFGDGWLVKVRVASEVAGLLDRAAYAALTGADA